MEQANNVNEYLEILSRYREKGFEIYYRGQSEEFFGKLKPKICRVKGLIENESNMIRELSTMCKDDFAGTRSSFEFLAKAQHYALPTRLLDLTMNELVALYFATNEEQPKSNGNIYVYIQEGVNVDDTRVLAISLLSKDSNYDLGHLCVEFAKECGQDITPEEFLELISKPLFIRYCEKFEQNNLRLTKQNGTFFLSTNEISDSNINRNLITLDSIDPNLIIRIPYEFKKGIIEELNNVYDVNDHSIFPELPSACRFLEKKYETKSKVEKYSFILREERDISLDKYRRISVIIELGEKYKFDEIRNLSLELVDRYKESWDEVWINISKNSDDYITKNYLFEGRWIKDLQNNNLMRKPFPNSDNTGYSWIFNNSYTTLNDYYQKSMFDSDKNLFAYHLKIYNDIYPIYSKIKMLVSERNIVELIKIIEVNEKQILDSFLKLQDYGRSHNLEFDQYLDLFSKWLFRLDDLKSNISNYKIEPNTVLNRVAKIISDITPIVERIESSINIWREKIGITESEIIEVNIDEYKKPRYQYTQTIPVSKSAINVWFDYTVEIKASSIRVHGRTNIFDNAELLIGLKNETTGYSGQCKSIVLGNTFVSDWFSSKGMKLVSGNYNISFFLSLPTVQDSQFVDRAGLEYENLTGDLVRREGVGPVLEFTSNYHLVEDVN